MGEIGIIKVFDKLGRIVIPKELRERFGLDSGVEIIATKEGVILRSPKFRLVEKENQDISEEKEFQEKKDCIKCNF